METVNNPATPFYPPEPDLSRSLQASQTQLAAISSSRSLDLDLTTEEGDKVTLSIDATASALYAAHGEAGLDDGALYARWQEFSAAQYEREVSFTVEGDLNKAERREIRKVIKSVSRMMHQFVQGKLNPMISKAHQLRDLETIDALEVEMSYQRSVVLAQQTQAAVTYDRNGESAPVNKMPSQSIDPPAVEPPVIQKPEIRHPLMEAAEAVGQDAAREVAFAPVPVDPLRELAHRLLQAYRDLAAEWDSLAGQMIEHIQDVFDAAMESFEQFTQTGEAVSDSVEDDD